MARRFLPYAVPYTVGTPAAYKPPVPSGRALNDKAMDSALHGLAGAPLSAQMPPHDRSQPQFPHVIQA